VEISLGRGFFRRLPRKVRLLWYAIVAVTALELALVIGTLIFWPGWGWLALQLFSLSLWPVGVGVGIVLVVGSITNRGSHPAAVPAAPSQPAAGSAATAQPRRQPEEGYEVAAARGAAQLLAGAARTPQGKAALRRTARLARAVRAAATPSEVPARDGSSHPATPSEPGRGGEERP
jgi:hypothetical protein